MTWELVADPIYPLEFRESESGVVARFKHDGCLELLRPEDEATGCEYKGEPVALIHVCDPVGLLKLIAEHAKEPCDVDCPRCSLRFAVAEGFK